MSQEKNRHQSNEVEKGFDKIIIKILDFLKLTTGTGLIGLAGFWFIFTIIQFMSYSINDVGGNGIQQQHALLTFRLVEETFFLQALLALLIVAIGILIREVKKLQPENTISKSQIETNSIKKENIDTPNDQKA